MPESVYAACKDTFAVHACMHALSAYTAALSKQGLACPETVRNRYAASEPPNLCVLPNISFLSC